MEVHFTFLAHLKSAEAFTAAITIIAIANFLHLDSKACFIRVQQAILLETSSQVAIRFLRINKVVRATLSNCYKRHSTFSSPLGFKHAQV